MENLAKKIRNYSSHFILTSAVGFFLIFSTSCGFTEYKNPDPGLNQPQTSAASTGATPVPITSTGTSTFTLVNSQILQPKCLGCHGSGSSPDFSTYGSFATNTQWVTPGNPAGSSIYTAVSQGLMPQGGTPLNASELSLISSWIQSGAANN